MSTRKTYLRSYNAHKLGSMRYMLNQKPSKNHFHRLVAFMHAAPIRVNTNLYRSVNTNLVEKLLKNGYLNDTYVSSFSKNKTIANNFRKNIKGRILILSPGLYQAINSTRKRRGFHFAEKEVTLAPGRYHLVGMTNTGNLRVHYTPSPLKASLN